MYNFTPRYWTGLPKLKNPTRLIFFLYVQKFFCTFRKIFRGSESTENNFSVRLNVNKKTLVISNHLFEYNAMIVVPEQ